VLPDSIKGRRIHRICGISTVDIICRAQTRTEASGRTGGYPGGINLRGHAQQWFDVAADEVIATRIVVAATVELAEGIAKELGEL